MKINKEDEQYPLILKQIKNPTKCIYYKGNIKLLEEPGISIVGSRKCTNYGKKMATEFSKKLSEYGVTIVSGMAKGIDSFAHKETIKVGGNTIAVLPCGLSNIYPKENRKLYEEILENNGLVITEYEEKEEASYNKFLERNRIVSGLSIGTLIIEGGYRSGTSVTAKLAKEQGKNVFCIPSSLENPEGITPNRLIKEGAFLVTGVEDIINQYPNMNLTKRKLNIKDENVEDEYKEIYNCLDYEKEIYINDIVKKVKLNITEVNYKLMMLELKDKIVSLPGNNYRKK